jgi:hypothetical protein
MTRFRTVAGQRLHVFRTHPLLAALTFVIVAVWLVFGLWFKVLGMVPRHRLIVEAILGEGAATPVTFIVGLGEIALAIWVLSGLYPRLCAAAQSLAIITMNTLELRLARGLLLAPVVMICANIGFLIAIWYCAFKTPETRS